jgi:hypothetical protein
MDECTTLNLKLHEIDNEIVFFGNYENQQAGMREKGWKGGAMEGGGREGYMEG